jgi:hypothetical protein
MKLIRVQMLRTRDQLMLGHFYNLPEARANDLIRQGMAKLPGPWPNIETTPVGPSEIKPIEPSETKEPKKKLLSRRGRTEKES